MHRNGRSAKTTKVFLPVVANTFFPGAGHIFLGKRVKFGTILLIGTIAALVALFLEISAGNADEYYASLTLFEHTLLFVSALTSPITFGYDAYTLAKEA